MRVRGSANFVQACTYPGDPGIESIGAVIGPTGTQVTVTVAMDNAAPPGWRVRLSIEDGSVTEQTLNFDGALTAFVFAVPDVASSQNWFAQVWALDSCGVEQDTSSNNGTFAD